MTNPSLRRLLAAVLVSAPLLTLPTLDTARLASATVAPVKARRLKNRNKIRALLRKKGLARLPSVTGALAAHTKRKHGRHALAEVTGTPPRLLDIPNQSVKDLFWQPGVVDAIIGLHPSPSQCEQFWAGRQDGESGGMGACDMAQNVGFSFGDILGSETSLCYMKNLPTPANIAAGAVSLVSGDLPGGDVTRLFSVPSGGTSRLVRVAVSGQPNNHGGEGQGPSSQNVFIDVHGDGENRAAGYLYAVDIWFCDQGASQPRGFDRIRIGSDGAFTEEDASQEQGGTHDSNFRGFVSFDAGQITWDTTQSRRARMSSVRPSVGEMGGSFKADHEIRPDNTIASKAYEIFGSRTHQGYVVLSFSGDGPDTLRFLAGGFKEHNIDGSGENDFVGSTEFRSTYYAASPGSALESQVAAVDFNADDFYASPPSASVDTSGFSCDATPDVQVALDFTNPVARDIAATCEVRLWERMQFCRQDPTVQAAEAAMGPACMGPH